MICSRGTALRLSCNSGPSSKRLCAKSVQKRQSANRQDCKEKKKWLNRRVGVFEVLRGEVADSDRGF